MKTSRRIDLKVGQEDTVRLPGLGTAGYVWEPDDVSVPSVVEVREEPASDPSAGPPQEEPAGKSVDQVFRIRAFRAGEMSLRFRQRRPWEVGREPINEHIVDIHVAE
jgi:predicted secreted protein